MIQVAKQLSPTKKFDGGKQVVTEGARAKLIKECGSEKAAMKQAIEYFEMHLSGNWGGMPPEDKAQNDAALKANRIPGAMLMSSYKTGEGPAVMWVITDCDRAHTTLLLPEEY